MPSLSGTLKAASGGWARVLALAVVLGAGLLASLPAVAQAPGTWRIHAAQREVRSVTADTEALWAGTDGGVFRYAPASGEIERFTTAEGLTRLDVRAVAYDARRDAVWIGYDDGVLDRLDVASGAVTSFFAIARADRFPRRGINRIRVGGDSLYLATAFGVVVFDAARGEVRDTYERFGAFEGARPVYDVLIAPLLDGSPGLWVGTEDGVAHAPLDAPNLRVPASWTILAEAPAPALALATYAGEVYVGKGRRAAGGGRPAEEGDLYRLSAAGWERLGISDDGVPDLVVVGDRLLAVSLLSAGFVSLEGEAVPLYPDSGILLSATVGPDGRAWIGTQTLGLAHIPDLATIRGGFFPERLVVPEGPLLNTVSALDVGHDGTLWVGYAPRANLNGLSRFGGARWDHFSSFNGFDVPGGRIRVLKVDRRGMAWGGSDGGGLVRVTADGEVTAFDSNNSTLLPEPGTVNFIIIPGIDEDAEGRVWITNRSAPRPLHVWDPDAGWTSFARPQGVPASANRFGELHIDRFGQKWIGLISTTQPRGDGFIGLRTDGTERITEAVAVPGTGSAVTGIGLPDPGVNAFVEDASGRLWLGTQRGLAILAAPGSAFADPAFARPAWALPADLSASAYLLRDLTVYAMVADPAGRLWLASNDGVWLIDETDNAVLAHFTPDNSPLPTRAVVDVAVDAASGMVYFATSSGVAAYRGDTVQPARRAEDLRVFPNPFRPGLDADVRVEGLVAETRVRILTPDGQVVASFDVRGGSVSWDGRDERTGQPVPSGVYLVAAAGRDGEGAAYGKIAVIR